jgi:lipid-binding SYLF domain-containing protein
MLRYVVLMMFVSVVVAQKAGSEKFQHAVERSQDAARIVSLLSDNASDFPRELVAKAQVVAVFPHVTKQDALVRKFLQGYGVVSARTDGGWSLPGFYQFESAPRKFAGGSQENFGLILLFMSNDALSWLDKDKSEFKKERAAVVGPVGDAKVEQTTRQIVAYTYYNGKLNGKIDPDFFNNFILDQDNNINLPIYGCKARNVLGGKKIDRVSLPTGLSAFSDALEKAWPQR